MIQPFMGRWKEVSVVRYMVGLGDWKQAAENSGTRDDCFHATIRRYVHLFNESRPTHWEQVNDYIDQNGSIGNAEVRQLVGSGDVLTASKQLRKWVARGQLAVLNPDAAKRFRRYTKLGTAPAQTLFTELGEP